MLKEIFWSGLKAFVPVVLTLAIVVWIFQGVETLFGRFLQYFIPPQYYFDGLGILVGIVLIFFIGILVNAWIIKQVYAAAEGMVKRIPGVKTIYNAIQDMVDFFDKTGHNEQQAVVLETALGRMVGFVTKTDLTNVPEALSKDKDVLVYIPLSYQVGGLMLAMSHDDIKPIDVSVNEAMSMVLTAGMGGKNKS